VIDMIAVASVPKRAFTEKEASSYTGMSPSFFRQSRMDGIRENRTPGPPFIKIGRAVRYLREDLDTWLKKYRQEPSKGEE